MIPQSVPISVEDVRARALAALSSAGQTMLTSMLEAGEWTVAGNELNIRVSASATLIEMSASSEARRLILASVSGALGRPIKLQILPGVVPKPMSIGAAPTNGGSRSRAEQEPVVQRMKEKFGAEIRTIIDYRKK
jgi:DNA polymerase-3 subunit gamma/tau